MADPKRKRDDLSSTSSLDTSNDLIISGNHEITEKKLTKGQKKKKTKIQKQELELKLTMSSTGTESKKHDNKTQVKPKPNEKDNIKPNETNSENLTIEANLAKINDKLDKVLTKDDQSFLKTIIKETILDLKSDFLASVINRIDKLEGDLHDIALENTQLKTELQTLKNAQIKQNEDIETEQITFKNDIETKNLKLEETLHDHEQYSRRNNIKIHNMPGDHKNETSLETTYKVLETINQNLDLHLRPQSIDIAHRLGNYRPGRNRRVIVKFVHRQVKYMVMDKTQYLKGTGIHIFEDLTQLHNKVLASVRKKSPDEVEEAWYRNGGIHIRWKASGNVQTLPYEDYQTWLNLPWMD